MRFFLESFSKELTISIYNLQTLETRISGKFIPIAVKNILRRQEDTDSTKAAMLDMYANALKYLKEWTVQFDKYRVFEWMNITKVPTFTQIESSVEFLLDQNVRIDDVKCFDQFKALTNFIQENQGKDEFKNKLSHERWVMFFKSCVSIEQYSEFETIAQYLFAIPAHNANVERIFSMIKAQWTDERNRLLIESVKSIILLKYNFKGVSCENFFNMIRNDQKFLEKIKSSDKYCYERRVKESVDSESEE